jgi:hypothetical protein
MEWFHEDFIPEVKKHLKEERLEFKVLLIINNAPAHTKSTTKISRLPPTTTSSFQPRNSRHY